MISEDLLEELVECTTTRRRWWAVKFENGGYYGEVVEEDGDTGFDLKLFSSKNAASTAVREFLEGEDLPYKIIEICWADVGGA